MVSNKTFNLIVTELFFRESKLNISLVFITQSYLAVPKKIRLNSTPYFVTKIPTRCNAKQYSFLVFGTTLKSDNSSRFRKNL